MFRYPSARAAALAAFAAFAAFPAVGPAPSFAAAPPRSAPSPGEADGARTVWVFFADKDLSGAALERAIREAGDALDPRARARRAKTAGAPAADVLDVPVAPRYLDAVRATGARVRHPSRWLNAASVRASEAEIAAIEALPFVASVRGVAGTRHRLPRVERVDVAPAGRSGDPRSVTYGDCASQIVPIQVDRLHDAGLTGAGVLVALFDTGFLRTHQALDQVNVVAEHDFVQGDGNTVNEVGDDPSQHNHGTMCLSLVGGFDPGHLVGTAYGASYVLAKTETLLSETPAEEDHWVAAAEWAEGLGVDVISSSLGYKDWYTYADMDGETAPITIAADLAVTLGVSVFTSAGNEGDGPWFFVTAPADGDLVMSIGAVDSLDTIAPFSSHGPTFDGRTKPDVCAMGRGDLVALPSDDSGYGRGSGTSFSCPLSAGVAALLLQAHPSWGPMQVREALRSTASRAESPDDTYGWGVLRGWDARGAPTAIPEIAAGEGVDGGIAEGAPAIRVRVAPNPSFDRAAIDWAIDGSRLGARDAAGVVSIAIHDAAGRLVESFEGIDARRSAGTVVWDGKDERGVRAPSGVYWVRVSTGAGTRSERIVRLR